LPVEVAERPLQVADQAAVDLLGASSLDRLQHAGQNRFHAAERSRERARRFVDDHSTPASRGDAKRRKVDEPGEPQIRPRVAVEPERSQLVEALRHQRARRVDRQSGSRLALAPLAGQVDLEADRRVARHLDRPDSLQPIAQKTRRPYGDHLLRPAAGHPILDDYLDRAGQQLTAQLRGEVVRRAPTDQSRLRLAVQPHDDDLGPPFVERQPTA
jgi:hypothetical protein